MKIAFDAQLLFEKQKTGIGWTVEHLLKNMNLEDDNEYSLNYFSPHHRTAKRKIIQEYVKLGYHRIHAGGCIVEYIVECEISYHFHTLSCLAKKRR